jgi:hypothetical protein
MARISCTLLKPRASSCDSSDKTKTFLKKNNEQQWYSGHSSLPDQTGMICLVAKAVRMAFFYKF